MNLCGLDHEEVCYESSSCPVCDEKDELEQEIGDLKAEVEELKAEVYELKEEMKNAS